MDDRTVTGRVVAVLDAVCGLRGEATLAALTRSTGIPKPSVRRIAADLVARGLLAREDDRYRLGPHLLHLGVQAAEQQGLRMAATPSVQDLFARTGEIVWLSSFTETTNALVGSAFARHRAAEMRRPWPARIRTAGFLSTAAGLLLLAHRPELAAELRARSLPRLTRYTDWPRIVAAVDRVRDTGIAVEHEQAVLGFGCVAAGVYGRDGALVGAIGVIGRAGQFAPERFSRPVRAAATEVSRALPDSRPDEPG